MSAKSPSNLAASVRQRLLNRAKNDHRPFNELLQYYAMERFLYRLSRSPHAKRFVLKGALMLRAWNAPGLLMGYSRESVIAEKFEAMVRHRELNSRMKDFYDVWLLARQFDFEGKDLGEAIRLTFDKRGVSMPEVIIAFTGSFISDKQVAWTAFRKRLEQEAIPKSFAEVVAVEEEFLSPVVKAFIAKHHVSGKWRAPGPWQG